MMGKVAGVPLPTVTMGRTLDTGLLLFGLFAKSSVTNDRKLSSWLFFKVEILQQVSNETVYWVFAP